MFQPGSFSKNFGWKGNGLHKLRDAVRFGFQGKLEPVSRELWRVNSEILDRERSLLAANFFLYNTQGLIAVDELVRLAICEEYSPIWDRVAFFALNLSRVGTPPRSGDPCPMAWANVYLRSYATDDGRWKPEALTPTRIDAFLRTNLEAEDHTRRKCRTNYSHMLKLSGAAGHGRNAIPAEEWVPFALYLAWDRYLLDGAVLGAELIDMSRKDELHKIAGVDGDAFWRIAREAHSRYLSVGGLARLTSH
jgi:hypothetical protein